MRSVAPFMLLLAMAAPAQAQTVSAAADIEIFDGPSKKLQKTRGAVIVDDFTAVRSGVAVRTTGGKALCSGTRIARETGGDFSGKCFGIPAKGTYTQDPATGRVNFRWNFSGSWIRVRATFQ